MTTFNLEPMVGSRKGFYGKAKVIAYDNGVYALLSYNTIVAAGTMGGGLYRTWAGYSATTMRHIESFAAFLGTEVNGKRDWEDNYPLWEMEAVLDATTAKVA